MFLARSALLGWSLKLYQRMEGMTVPQTVIFGTEFVEQKYPLKSGGFRGYVVPKLVSKLKSHISYIIETEMM